MYNQIIQRHIDNNNFLSIFYRNHIDPRNNEVVITLTESGLISYFNRRLENLLDQSKLIIDLNLDVNSSFSPSVRNELKENFSNNNGVNNYVIHRDGHTVALLREGNTFLLLDSYNAHGTPDNDNLPLLKIIREANPDAEIYTLHDRIQSDYNNCRIFAIESIVEIRKYIKNQGLSLNDLVNENITQNIFEEENNNYETPVEYRQKEDEYQEIDVKQISVPVPLVPFIQSYSAIIKSLNNDFSKLNVLRENNKTYLSLLTRNIALRNNRLINNTIQNIADRNSGYFYNLYNDLQNLNLLLNQVINQEVNQQNQQNQQ